jgi:hypothetical protein
VPLTDIPLFSAYNALPFSEQLLHGLHFMLCSFAVLVACVPLMTQKGSAEHKFAGLIYLPLSFAALTLASFMAWRESSFTLFCFNAFCAWLLLSGWRAMHEDNKPGLIDWALPAGLLTLSATVMLHAMIYDEGMRSLYLFGFAFNGFYLSWRDGRHLAQRVYWNRYKTFLPDTNFAASSVTWLNRHVAGMIGSMMANLSVVVLTLLPLELHWLWPAGLLLAGAVIALKEQQKKMRVRRVLAPVLKPGFGRRKTSPHDAPLDDLRKAA